MLISIVALRVSAAIALELRQTTNVTDIGPVGRISASPLRLAAANSVSGPTSGVKGLRSSTDDGRALQAASPSRPPSATPSLTASTSFYQNTHCINELTGTLWGQNASTNLVPFPTTSKGFVGASGLCTSIVAGPQHLYQINLPDTSPLGGQLVVDTCNSDAPTWVWVGYGCPGNGLPISIFDCVAADTNGACGQIQVGAARATVDFVASRLLCVVAQGTDADVVLRRRQ